MTITVKKYTNSDKNVWNEFIKNSKNGIFMFDRNFMDYHSDRFNDFSLMFYNDDKLAAVMPLSVHGDEVRSHGGLTYGGIICDNSMKQHRMLEIFECLKSFLKNNGIKKLLYKTLPSIYHKQPSEEDLYALFANGAKLVRRDISTTINLKDPIKPEKGRKAQISRAKREGVTVEESTDFETFIELENKILSEYHNTTAVHSAEELRLLKSAFENRIKLYVGKLNNKIIAGTVIFIYDNVVHTQYMAADETARTLGGLDLVIRTLTEKYKEEKTYFDFGISTENNGTFLNRGLIAQKESFGGRGIVYDFYELEIL